MRQTKDPGRTRARRDWDGNQRIGRSRGRRADRGLRRARLRGGGGDHSRRNEKGCHEGTRNDDSEEEVADQGTTSGSTKFIGFCGTPSTRTS